MQRNWSYTIKEGEHKGKTLWSGRYCAVCAIVLYLDPILGWMILLNKRGSGLLIFSICGIFHADI